nr:SUMF1/EgtB/PvdO family nonheme iron enzyme [Flavilitoribacter sp.]
MGIGINDYQHCTKLNNAVSDVEAFIELMVRRFKFEASDITFIKDLEATKKRIEREFIRLARTVKPQDNLVIYFSGHGRYDPDLGGNWVPVEAGAGDDDWTDYLSNDFVKSYLSRINSFHTFLIADSCFSGALFIDKTKEKFSGDRRDDERSRWGLTSGKKEIVSDGNPGEHSPFAVALLDVLERADRPPGVMHICDLVLEKVIANSMQSPMGSPLAVQGHQGGQMVFYLRADEDADWAAMQLTHEGCTQYLVQYPEGKYKLKAEAIVANAKEEAAWQKAVAANNKLELLDFERHYPQSPYVTTGELDCRIADLEDKELWAEAVRSNTLSAYRDYKNRMSAGKHRKEADEAVAAILNKEQEIRAWQTASAEATGVAYEKYLEQYPEGAHAAEVRVALDRIKTSAKEKDPPRSKPPVSKENQTETPQKHKRPPQNDDRDRLLKDLENRKKQRKKIPFLGIAGHPAAWLVGSILVIIGVIWTVYLVINHNRQTQSSPNVIPQGSITIPADSMVLIKGGNFQMGSNDGETDEKPIHSVTLSDFYMGIHEVTVGEFARFAAATGYKTEAEKNNDRRNWRHDTQGNFRPAAAYNHPVIYVSWNDAAAYCNWLSEQHGYR